MRRTALALPIEPAEPFSHVIKGHHAPWANPEPSPIIPKGVSLASQSTYLSPLCGHRACSLHPHLRAQLGRDRRSLPAMERRIHLLHLRDTVPPLHLLPSRIPAAAAPFLHPFRDLRPLSDRSPHPFMGSLRLPLLLSRHMGHPRTSFAACTLCQRESLLCLPRRLSHDAPRPRDVELLLHDRQLPAARNTSRASADQCQ